MKRVFYVTLGLLVMTLGCQTNQKLTDQQKDLIVKAVKERSQQFFDINKSYNTESLQKTMSFSDENIDKAWLTDPAEVVFDINIIKTRADVQNFWGMAIESRISTNITMTEDHFAVLSKDQVVEVNKADYTITGKDSITSGPYTMVHTIVWVNINGEWKMLHIHQSSAKKTE
jgi:ketosteroid isomerase-like protein